jgi:allantoinase
MEGPEEKGDFFSAWGGISSVGLGLPILWTEGTKRDENFSVEEIVRWCCKNTAKQVGLEKSKGDLGVGFDADIVVFDDAAEFMVSPLPDPRLPRNCLLITSLGRAINNALP